MVPWGLGGEGVRGVGLRLVSLRVAWRILLPNPGLLASFPRDVGTGGRAKDGGFGVEGLSFLEFLGWGVRVMILRGCWWRGLLWAEGPSAWRWGGKWGRGVIF